MSGIAKIINEIIHGKEGYQIEPQGTYPCHFYSLCHEDCKRGVANSKLQNQFVYLRMLCENGEAELAKDGFLVRPEIIAQFGPDIRLLFDLPGAWPGSFELTTKGQTYLLGGFNISLVLKTDSEKLVRDYRLDGPFLFLSGNERYLLDYPQYLTLNAIKTHAELPLSKQTEEVNLTTISVIQQAKKDGLNINMRHFEEIDVESPSRIGIAIQLEPDGHIHISPEFGIDGISPEEIESRLEQLHGEGSTCIRIKTKTTNKIVKLTEKQLRAIQEILANRDIPAEERDSFLKAPGTFLDSYLVDLDNGFSIRVRGSEVFKPAYFGETDTRHIDWYDNERGVVIPLRNLLNMDLSYDKKCLLVEKIGKAIDAGENIVEDDGLTIILPPGRDESRQILDEIKNKPTTASLQKQKEESVKTVVAVELNDDVLFNETSSFFNEDLGWRGELYIEDLLLKPFDYQLEGIRWFVGHAIKAQKSNDKMAGALLADDMGLGKTFMTMAGIYAWQRILKQDDSSNYFSKPILVVAPLVLLENWKDEIKKYFSESPFRDVVVLQSDGDLRRFRNNVKHDSENDFALKIGRKFITDRLDLPKRLVLTTYASLQKYQFSLSAVDWGCVIFDEAQNIKSPNALSSRAAKALKADFRLAVTGTPVENNLIDFWNIFDTVKPGFLDTCRNFRETYIKPINEANENEDVRFSVGKNLRNKVSHYMLRRSKEEKLSSLPNKIIYAGCQTDGVNLVPLMSGEQLDKYNQVVREVQVAKKVESKDLQKLVLSSLHKMRDISLHPNLLTEMILPQSRSDAQNFINQSSKLVSVQHILEVIKSRGEKVIIFVINRKLQFYLSIALKMVFNLSDVLIVNGETSAVEKNTGDETRKTIIEKFESQAGFGIIIMSPLAAGVGLTIVGANNVIHLERHWNPAKEAQATDRVYRIGQKKDVNIYVPILDHPEKLSFDRNLDQLLQKKTDLKDAVISPGELKPTDFNTEQIFGIS